MGLTSSMPAAPSGVEAQLDAEPATTGTAGEPSAAVYREWTQKMPEAGSELFEAFQVALHEANMIHSRKYRYGALLVAGDDHIPFKSGSNKKLFKRTNMHAEASVLLCLGIVLVTPLITDWHG